jgi:hypothetical protein
MALGVGVRAAAWRWPLLCNAAQHACGIGADDIVATLTAKQHARTQHNLLRAVTKGVAQHC